MNYPRIYGRWEWIARALLAGRFAVAWRGFTAPYRERRAQWLGREDW